MSESEQPRDEHGRFMERRAVDTEQVRDMNDANSVGTTHAGHVDDSVRFWPVHTDTLREMLDRVGDAETVMLAAPPQRLPNGAKTCMVLMADEEHWWTPWTHPRNDREYPHTIGLNRIPVHVGAGVTYTYNGGADE